MVELARAWGTDERLYQVRTMQWDVAKAERYWERTSKFAIFSDAVPANVQGFLSFILEAGALWWEIVDLEADETVGLMYITDVTVENQIMVGQATWHAFVWDAKAGPRRPVLRAAIKALFEKFRFHRLQAEIPLHFGGVIRSAKKLGFREEGRMRQARMYNGVRYDALMMSILSHEALNDG